MESSRESIVKKAQALTIVKAVLGEHFVQHKQAVLTELFSLEVTEAFASLNDLLQSGTLFRFDLLVISLHALFPDR
jgi:hypothetical protein